MSDKSNKDLNRAEELWTLDWQAGMVSELCARHGYAAVSNATGLPMDRLKPNQMLTVLLSQADREALERFAGSPPGSFLGTAFMPPEPTLPKHELLAFQRMRPAASRARSQNVEVSQAVRSLVHDRKATLIEIARAAALSYNQVWRVARRARDTSPSAHVEAIAAAIAPSQSAETTSSESPVSFVRISETETRVSICGRMDWSRAKTIAIALDHPLRTKPCNGPSPDPVAVFVDCVVPHASALAAHHALQKPSHPIRRRRLFDRILLRPV